MMTDRSPLTRKRGAGLLGTLLLLATLASGTSPGMAAERKNVWQQLDQFVAIESQDGRDAVVLNDHPAHLSVEAIRAALGSMTIRFGKNDKPEPLFTEGELATLGDTVRQGLSQAGPTEDVTFALIGLHPALLGLFKQQMVTTGRLFFSKGRLNLILGMVHEPVSDRDDRRLKPFVPGSRATPTASSWQVSARGGAEVQAVSGRPDWLVLSLAEPGPAGGQAAESISRPAPASLSPAAPAPVPAAKPSAKSMEERLLLLKGLHDKGLITEEEYRAKRLEILGEL